MCLAGVCEDVGYDLELSSEVKLDRCGVCGGKGLSCANRRYTWKKEAHTKCSAACGGGRQVFQHFCMDINSNEKVHFEFGDANERPETFFENCNCFSYPAR